MTSGKCLRVLRCAWPLWLQFTRQSTEIKHFSYVKVDSGPCGRSFRGSGARVFAAECELFCALQTCFTCPGVMSEIDIFVSLNG